MPASPRGVKADMPRARSGRSCVILPVALRLFYKIRLFRAGGVIGAFLLLTYLSMFRAKTRAALPARKNRQFCKIPAKAAPAHLTTVSAAFAGMRKEDSRMEANEYPPIEGIHAAALLSRPVFLYKLGARMYKGTFINHITIP